MVNFVGQIDVDKLAEVNFFFVFNIEFPASLMMMMRMVKMVVIMMIIMIMIITMIQVIMLLMMMMTSKLTSMAVLSR